MILFSTVLEINNKMTKDDFIKLVIEWNQGSPHQDNVIQNIVWNGERNIRYGTEKLWLDIQEYRNQNIIAVRYEKIEGNGIVWDTDYVMNFNEMKMSIQLDRSYLEEALVTETAFSTPHFITLLIEKGYLCDDEELPVLKTPILINNDNLKLLADVVNGKKRYQLPIVYVSKTYYDEDPVDIYKLSGRLKGVAHVFVQEGTWLNPTIRKMCDSKNEFHGAIGIYYPNIAIKNKRFIYREYDGSKSVMLEKVIHTVIQYCNVQLVEKLYTWQGVSNELLRDRLRTRAQELVLAETEKERVAAEADELLESVDEDINKLKNQVAELTRANDILKYENQGLRTKLSTVNSEPILFLGEEEEFFSDEIKAILLDALEVALTHYGKETRRYNVIEDIVRENNCKRSAEEKAEQLKNLLKGYKVMTGSMKKILQEMGFIISEEGKHYKMTYYGDARYWATLAKTPSDNRSGMNVAMEIIRDMF